MKFKPRVVFDTNIFISAIIFGGNPRRCLELARSGEIELFASRTLLLELSNKLKEKFLWEEYLIKEVIEGILVFTRVVAPSKKVSVVKSDPDDNRVLEVAQEATADYIVSGDKKHLPALEEFEDIPILTATQFLEGYFKHHS